MSNKRVMRPKGDPLHSAGRLWQCWKGIRWRCGNPAAVQYARYGGRGIGVCDRWQAFAAFAADMGPHPGAGFSIDRIDNNGNYEPGNVRWATRLEQAQNRTCTRRLDGRLLADVAAERSANPNTVAARWRRGFRRAEVLFSSANVKTLAPACRRGHERNEANVYTRPNGKRVCRACKQISTRKSRAKK